LKLIEVTGIPGSGKSTVLPVVKNYLRKRGLEVFDSRNIILCIERFPFDKSRKLAESLPPGLGDMIAKGLNRLYVEMKYRYKLKYLLSNRELFSYIVDLTNSRNIPHPHKILTVGWFLNLAASYQIASEHSGSSSVLLLDEGFVHRVIHLFVSVEEETIDAEKIERYLEKIPPIQTLIMVEANEVLCKNRIISRGLPRRLRGRTDEEIWEYLLSSKAALDNAQRFVSRRGTNIVSLDNSSEQFSQQGVEFQLSRSPGFTET